MGKVGDTQSWIWHDKGDWARLWVMPIWGPILPGIFICLLADWRRMDLVMMNLSPYLNLLGGKLCQDSVLPERWIKNYFFQHFYDRDFIQTVSGLSSLFITLHLKISVSLLSSIKSFNFSSYCWLELLVVQSSIVVFILLLNPCCSLQQLLSQQNRNVFH